MAIKITSDKGIISAIGGTAFRQTVEIIADTEAEITALGETVTDMYQYEVIPAVGSVAYTADLSAGYMLSPSGVWKKAW